MLRTSRLIVALVMVCCFFSGVAGLVYEIVWTRYLALFLGHTSYAVLAVLVAFMGGLALGNAWLGRWVDRVRHPLRLYGWLEVGIAVYALVFPGYYTVCHNVFVAVARSWQPGSGAMLALKFAFSLLTVLLPTVLMGGTLPALARFATASLSQLRTQVARFYWINSAGAAVGCIVADFWWIPTLGLLTTLLAAAGINLIAGLVALLLSLKSGKPAASQQSDAPTQETVEAPILPGDLKLAIFAIGVSGFVAMLYEVAWTRLLALALGSSTHAFSLMLATFIAGLAVGACLIAQWKNLRRTFDAFAWAELALAATLLGTMFLYEYLPFGFTTLAGLLARKEQAYPLYELFQASICFGVMFVPTVCLGMTLPLASRIATSELAQTGRSVGRVFAVNTLGTVLGAALTGLWLMPWLGLARTFAVGVAANALVGAAILGRKRWMRRPALIGIVLVFAVWLVWASGAWFQRWPRALTLELWRGQPPASLAEYRTMEEDNRLEFYSDGADATVSVSSSADDPGVPQLRLRTNGRAEASATRDMSAQLLLGDRLIMRWRRLPASWRDMSTQLLLGHLPMLLRPRSERALVIGLGSGVTCGAVATHPSIRQIDVVEISPDVARAARLFQDYNGHVLDDPRLRLHLEDAKTYLQIAPHRYGLIVSEPSHPWTAGVAGVFTAEFYQSCRDRLEPDGLMVQWIHYYESDDRMLDTVLATFVSVFPYATVWEPALGDVILVGAAKPWTVDLNALEARLKDNSVQQDLRRVGLNTPAVLLALEAIPQDNTRFVPAPDALVHTDVDPVLEYIAERAFFARGFAQRWKLADERFSPRCSTLLARYLESHPLTEPDFKALNAWYCFFGPSGTTLFRSLLHRWQHDLPGDPQPLQTIAALSQSGFDMEPPLERFAGNRDTLLARAEHNPQPLRSYCEQLYRAYVAQRSVFYLPPTNELEAVLQRLIETDPSNRRVNQLLLAELAWDHRDDRACIEWGQKALENALSADLEQTLQSESLSPILAHVVVANAHAGRPKEANQICSLVSQSRKPGVLLCVSCRRLAVVTAAGGADRRAKQPSSVAQ
jgi:spermidine synthase